MILKSFVNIVISVFAVAFLSSSAWGQQAVDSALNAQNLGVLDTNAVAHSPKVNQQIEEIIQFSKKFLGTPYKWAGSTPSGFDCSGFIYYVMGNFGVTLSRSSPGIAEFGKTVKLAELQPGDLMFFKGRNVNSSGVGHVAMVVEVNDGVIKFIHSASRGVSIDTFNSSKYYIPRFIKAKRLDYGGILPY